MKIDADAHVDETDATWEYLDGGEQRFRPTTIDVPNRRDKGWSVQGLTLRRPVRDFNRTGVTKEAGQLLDVSARVHHLDALGIDLQVLYPTAFIGSKFVGHEDLELALKRSYNRWIAARTGLSNGRLRWIAVLPLLSIGESVKELQWAKENGACGVFKKGVECGGKSISDPYFFPLYEAASDLDLPICIHAGSESGGILQPSALGPVQAFHPLVTSGLLEKYPVLRVGFIEAGASWIPFLLTNIAAIDRRSHLQGLTLDNALNVDLDLFRRLRIYVTFQSQEDLSYLLRYGIEDNLMVGTDYTHADQSAELKALDYLEERGRSSEISDVIARKILDDNPRRFYGL